MLYAILDFLEEGETYESKRAMVRTFHGTMGSLTAAKEDIVKMFPNDPEAHDKKAMWVIGNLSSLEDYFFNRMTDCSDDDGIDYDYDGMWRDARTELVIAI